MSDWRKTLTSTQRNALGKSAHPKWLAPMLATLTDKRFSDPNWIYERKLDGERLLLFRNGNRIRLMTRNRKQVNDTYPEIITACRNQDCTNFVADGELVAFENGVSSFSRLQRRMQISSREQARNSRVAVYFYIFDLPYLEGFKLDALPLRKRKALLKQKIRFDRRLRFTPHRNRDGEDYFRQACDKGWEGIIAKRADSAYSHKRSTDWLKFKCTRGQELVIGGFTEPGGSRTGFGALLVGYYQDDELRYAGKVGIGFDDDFLEDFRARLDKLSTRTSPFEDAPQDAGITWVKPELVGEFGFTEWTHGGRLRHPRFLGLRRDKNARDVVRESAGD